jgi:hypothetical protein
MTSEQANFDVFFSYNHQDHLAVETIARDLQEAGLRVYLDRWYLAAGISWPEHLESVLNRCRAVAVFLGMYGLGRWQQPEKYLALDRQAKDPTFPVIPVLLPKAEPALGFLSLNTWVDFGTGIHDAEALAILVAAVRGLPPGPTRRTTTEICPYRGLRYFREEDAPFFFGREEFVDQLVDAIDRKPLVAVAGASGSGKSSVVRAGLIHRLRKAHRDRVWDVVTMVPGDRPLHALAAALVPLLEPEMSETDRLVQTGKLATALTAREVLLRDVVTRALAKQPGTDRLLLVLDQCEELYTLTRAEDLRRQFVDEIRDATTASALSVVITLRAEFLNNVIGSFIAKLNDAIYITPMSGQELHDAIELPAQKVGLDFEPGLVQRIIEKVEGRPGDLPLLEFVLAQLWERRERGRMTHAAYTAIGQVEGAIARHADMILRDFSPEEQAIARRIFLQVIRPTVPSATDEAEEMAKPGYVRRRASFAELGAEALPVVRKLADAHLIVTSRNEVMREEIVDLVHEALIEKWDTLRDWVANDRPFLVWREQLRTLRRFSGSGDETFLLTGHLLRAARLWLRERPSDLTDSERKYIERSARARTTKVSLGFAAVVIVVLAISALVYEIRRPKPVPPNMTTSGTVGDTATSETATNASEPEEQNAPSPTQEAAYGPPLTEVRVPMAPVRIPVVVHVVYRTNEENVSAEQIASQIAALNRDFRKRNSDLATVPEPFKDRIGDAMIEFALATRDPRGRPTNGITRTKTSVATITDFTNATRRLSPAWPADRYLNVWVCNLGESQLEYSTSPGSPPREDGITVNYRAFGTIGNALLPNFSKGRSATHALGHYLGLRHIWGDNNGCAGDDFVADTPLQAKPNYVKPKFPHISCNNGPAGDMFMNFMDYTDDDVAVMFTKGQVARMHQTLQGKRRLLTAQ